MMASIKKKESSEESSKTSVVETGERTDYTLQDCFNMIINGSPLKLDLSNANTILKKSLSINMNTLKPKVRGVLPFMLIHFIKSWPGWQKANSYFNKQISFESWFHKFKEYLIFKLNFLIKNMDTVLKDQVSSEDNFANKVDKDTQTSVSGEKETAPFFVEIHGPARMLNSLVFSEGVQDDIMLKEYKVTAAWSDMLSIRQLINWPCVEIEFKSEELHFRRSNEHDFKRFLTFSSEKLFFNKPDKMIEEVEIIDEKVTREAYTLNAVKEYCNLYISILRKYQSLLSWSSRYLDQIETILEDFVLDIVDINMNSMATNTSVLFNIGNSIYARNKSIRTSNQAVCLTDSITPKMLLSLLTFSAIDPSNKDAPFHRLQQLLDHGEYHTLSKFIPVIVYRCTFCSEDFKNNVDLWIHLRTAHSMEQPVLCFRCKQQFKITDLGENRWRHQCNTKGNSVKQTQQKR